MKSNTPSLAQFMLIACMISSSEYPISLASRNCSLIVNVSLSSAICSLQCTTNRTVS